MRLFPEVLRRLPCSLLLVTLLAAVAAFVAPQAAQASFGVESFEAPLLSKETGAEQATQAGSHPYALTTTIVFNHTPTGEVKFGTKTEGDVKDLEVSLPVGVVVNPTATPERCTPQELIADNKSLIEGYGAGGCPNASAVGKVDVEVVGTSVEAAVYNMVPPHGAPAMLGFNAANIGLISDIVGGVRSGSDYGLTAKVAAIAQEHTPIITRLTLWGYPASEAHDTERGACLPGEYPGGPYCRTGSNPVGRNDRPFLTMPGACTGAPLEFALRVNSWQQPGVFPAVTPFSNLAVTGCEGLQFNPSVSEQPERQTAGVPTGLGVDLKVPQEESAGGLAESDVREMQVALPAGMTVNPSSVNGRTACSEQQIALSSSSSPTCPESSKIGSVEIQTPLLEHALTGSLYLAQQGNGGTAQGANPFGSLLALYLVAEGSGVVVKLPGEVTLNHETGQVTARFGEDPLTKASPGLPQLPFSDVKVDLFGGPRAPLVNPAACGTYSPLTTMTPWSGGSAVNPPASFTIDAGCTGSGGFAPAFTAGTTNNQADAFSPFTLTMSRQDGEQTLGSVATTMPPGLLGMISKVPLCGEAQANAGDCPAASQIGHVTTTAGVGSDPVVLPEAGRPEDPVFLTGAYGGGPFGLSIVVHPEAGPFNLEEGGKPVVVRAAIHVNPTTAQVSIDSGPIPSILQGIPLDVRMVSVTIDREGFMFNPTNCSPLSVTGTITSTGNASAGVSSPFEAANCANLPFKPKFTVLTDAATSKANGAYLHVKVVSGAGQANIAKVKVDLPLQLPSRLSTLQKACVAAVFEASPAGCPAASVVGTGTAVTPVLKSVLTGPAYLVSHGGAAFPDLEIVLQGEGITLILDGKTDIKKGITSSTFNAVPDAPISTFDLVLPEGPHSVLGPYLPVKAKYSMCGQGLAMPTEITAQNGAVVEQTTKIAVYGCPKAKKTVKAKKARAKKKKAKS